MKKHKKIPSIHQIESEELKNAIKKYLNKSISLLAIKYKSRRWLSDIYIWWNSRYRDEGT